MADVGVGVRAVPGAVVILAMAAWKWEVVAGGAVALGEGGGLAKEAAACEGGPGRWCLVAIGAGTRVSVA